ncbi:MAG: phosphohydrolase [Desulfobulbus sp.]|nr:MAG: phosphohydrolase [Desulfobulbus sp.]
MHQGKHQRFLVSLLAELNSAEEANLSALACKSKDGTRRIHEETKGYRQPFAQDADRILHSKSYARYIDKTQVFSLIDNDHITHRVLHVQMVSRIARTVGRFLGLNEDLIEAIALGHDIGHPPFGHEGERILKRLCRQYGLAGFQHNIQSVQFLDCFEKKGQGWNLTLQVLDGILCHDGEARATRLSPARDRDFAAFDRLIKAKQEDPMTNLQPMTLEGCVVRLCDTIAYIGRDIEDAIELGLVERYEIPEQCGRVLGTSNGTIVYTLVSDVIAASAGVRKAAEGDHRYDWVGFSPDIAKVLLELKAFNYERIYNNAVFKPDFEKIHICYEQLFDFYMSQLEHNQTNDEVGRNFLHSMSKAYINTQSSAAIVRDYIAGMTDNFFLCQAKALGCEIPERSCGVN